MRYRSRPSEVEAVQWTGDNLEELRAFFAPIAEMQDPVWEEDENGVTHMIDYIPNGQIELEAGADGVQGYVPVPIGHWIVRRPGDWSDHWPVDPDYFAAKYEPIEEP